MSYKVRPCFKKKEVGRRKEGGERKDWKREETWRSCGAMVEGLEQEPDAGKDPQIKEVRGIELEVENP